MLLFTSDFLAFRILLLVFQIEELVQFYCDFSTQILVPLTFQRELLIAKMYNSEVLKQETEKFHIQISEMEKNLQELVQEKNLKQ
jgi:hypothetical protein